MALTYCDKYAPKNIGEIIDSKDDIKSIINFMDKFGSHKYKCLLVSGTHGSGKSCRVSAIIKYLNYDIKYIDLNKFKQANDKIMYLRGLTECRDVTQLLKGENKKSVIVVDEMDINIVTQEKNQLVNLMKLNNDNNICPVIFIFDIKHSKLINSLRKGTYEIRIRVPTNNDMIKMMSIICIGEKIVLENKKIVDDIIEFSQNDLRKLCVTLYDIVSNIKCDSKLRKKRITCQDVNKYKGMTKEKELTPDLFNSTIKLLRKYENIEECLKLYEVEKVNIPLMIQQNYLYAMRMNDKCEKKISKITSMLSLGDVIDNYVYGEQRWDITNVHGYFSCCVPSYLLHDEVVFTKILGFPDDMGKTSNKKMNRKHILSASKIFDSVDPFDYIYMGKVFNKFVTDNRKDKLMEIMNKYKLTPSDIENIIKINKTSLEKTNFTKRFLK